MACMQLGWKGVRCLALAWLLAMASAVAMASSQGLGAGQQSVADAATASTAGAQKLDNTRPAWTVSCFSTARAADPDCKIEQRLFVKETGRVISVAVVDIPAAGRQPLLFMQLPNGLALSDGVSLSIDGSATVPLTLQSCDGNGCYATLALTPALITAMEKGKAMTLKAIAANRTPLVFEHLLTDFADAYRSAK